MFIGTFHSIAPFIVFLVYMIHLNFCINASLALREQVENGEYGEFLLPGAPQPSNAGPVRGSQIVAVGAESLTTARNSQI